MMLQGSYYSSNHFNAPQEVILNEARLNNLSTCERQKRPYEETDIQYWNNDIAMKRQRVTAVNN